MTGSASRGVLARRGSNLLISSSATRSARTKRTIGRVMPSCAPPAGVPDRHVSRVGRRDGRGSRNRARAALPRRDGVRRDLARDRRGHARS
jgi:hypothetical protein